MINKINNYPTIQNNWTHIIAKVQVGHNSNHLFTRGCKQNKMNNLITLSKL